MLLKRGDSLQLKWGDSCPKLEEKESSQCQKLKSSLKKIFRNKLQRHAKFVCLE